MRVRGARLGGRNGRKSWRARGDHGRIGYASKFARTLISHSAVGRSIAHHNYRYDASTRRAEVNLMLKRHHTLLLDEQD